MNENLRQKTKSELIRMVEGLIEQINTLNQVVVEPLVEPVVEPVVDSVVEPVVDSVEPVESNDILPKRVKTKRTSSNTSN